MRKYTNPEFMLDRVSCDNDICVSAVEETGSVPTGGEKNEQDSGNIV